MALRLCLAPILLTGPSIGLTGRAESCELGPIETTEPTGGTQNREYWGGPIKGRAAACRRRLAAVELAEPPHHGGGGIPPGSGPEQTSSAPFPPMFPLLGPPRQREWGPGRQYRAGGPQTVGRGGGSGGPPVGHNFDLRDGADDWGRQPCWVETTGGTRCAASHPFGRGDAPSQQGEICPVTSETTPIISVRGVPGWILMSL